MLARTAWLRRGVTCLALGAASFGCDPIRTTAHPEVEGYRNRPSYAMHLLYRQDIVASSRRQGEPYERGGAAIDVEHHRVFVGSSDRGLYALRAEDGERIWRFETLAPVQCEPLYDPKEEVVYFGSNDGALYKVAAATGKLLWRFATNAEVARRPVLVGNRLYFVNANDTVIAVDAASGKRIWSQHRAPALGMEVAGHGGVLVRGGLIFVAFSTGTVTAFDAASGREVWEPVDMAAEAEQGLGRVPAYLDVDTTPEYAIVAGVPAIVVGSYEGGVAALRADNGNQIWSNLAVTGTTDVSIWRQPAHTDERGRVHPRRRYVIASSGTTGLWALDLDSGTELWRRDLPDGGTSAPAYISGAILISTTQHGLFLVNPVDGAIIDGIHTQAGFSMPPATHGRRAFILSDSGQFLAFSVPAPTHRPRSDDWFASAY